MKENSFKSLNVHSVIQKTSESIPNGARVMEQQQLLISSIQTTNGDERMHEKKKMMN